MVRKIDLNHFQVARSETARDINARIMLNLVRKLQPISRASLARQSGLQRSTVSAITEQLIADNWLREGDTGHLPRGRKPKFLHLNEERGGIIGINVRPSYTHVALANLAGRFLVQDSMPTPASAGEFVDQISERIRQLKNERPDMAYEGIGVSLPGRVDPRTNRFVFAPNLGWHEEDLKHRLESSTGLSVDLENEANACALSEYWFGRHPEGAGNVIVIAVSEGIGTGIILNGQLVRGSTGLAGEFGHVTLSEDGPMCSCGNRGCWEVFASNQAAVRYYAEGAATNKNGKHKSAAARANFRFEDILTLAEQGDLAAVEAIDRMAHYLGLGVAMLVTGLAPDSIVVVGEVTRAWDRVGTIVTETAKQHSFTQANTRIVASGPALLPRLRGIVALVLQKHFGAPAIA